MAAYYSNTVTNFLQVNSNEILGKLVSGASDEGFYQLIRTQTEAWKAEIELLKDTFSKLSMNHNWAILLEYPIPRRNKRIDVVLIVDDKILVIEFKIGANQYLNADVEQLYEYCLDLRDFHFESDKKTLTPILVATDAPQREASQTFQVQDSKIYLANSENLHDVLKQIAEIPINDVKIDFNRWENSKYFPTYNIIESAQALYAGKHVKEINSTKAYAENLTNTTDAILEAIKDAKTNDKKIICFVTGVPGAGKTLVGLNTIHNRDLYIDGKSIGAFLSGNGPLVKILREALARDYSQRNSFPIGEARRQVKTLIYNVHEWLTDLFNKEKIPDDRVVVFDEAQRAWNREQSKRKFKRDYSEPEMMLSIMSRMKGWAVIIALVGGGQEINSGEAGLREWGNNLLNKFRDWEVFVSPQLLSGDTSTANQTLFQEQTDLIKVKTRNELHLSVPLRSLKSKSVADWVERVLEGKSNDANAVLINDMDRYPIYLTRSIEKAKEWLKYEDTCIPRKGRYGLVASSGFKRIRALGFDVTLPLEVENWFLDGKEDVRSSYFLELPATEFAIQGLELDSVCVCWGDDFRRSNEIWSYNKFKGTKWQKIQKDIDKQYLLNKYRVLLTRARDGMIIWVPEGDETDNTRKKEFYDETYNYLKICGAKELN